VSPAALPTVLLVQNHYLLDGGEDRVFRMERRLLEEMGHRVLTYTRHNEELQRIPAWRAAQETLWNGRTARELEGLVRAQGIQVVHFHNTFPRISPAAYRAVHRGGAATVQTLHNQRLLCTNAFLFRNGRPCHRCMETRLPLPALRHRCYRSSLAATAVVVLMQFLHRLLGTWRRDVDAYIALTEGARTRFTASLLPPDKVHVLGNFLPAGPMASPVPPQGPALFLGRLDEAKGVRTLLRAWEQDGDRLMPLVIAGDGPLAGEARAAAAKNPRIRYAGFCAQTEIQRLLEGASILLLPSECCEGFPMTLLEARAAGRPVLASRTASLEELIDQGRDGWLAEPAQPGDWAARLRTLAQAPELLVSAGAQAHLRFLRDSTGPAHYAGLMRIYGEALAFLPSPQAALPHPLAAEAREDQA